MYDVVISGAGPAGSHCANVLAKAGYKVALLERDRSRRKPCGGGIDYKVLDIYPQIKNLNVSKINGCALYSAYHHKFEVVLKSDKYSSVIDRFVLDNLMRDAAVDAGAELFDKTVAYDFLRSNGTKMGIKAKSNGGGGEREYRGRILVIAEGMGSTLAVKSGIRPRWQLKDMNMAKYEILEGPTALNDNLIHVFFFPFMGYGWIFPLGNNRVNVGAGGTAEDMARMGLDFTYSSFFNDPHTKAFLPANTYNRICGGSYPLPRNGVLEKTLYKENIMLIGDAGGFVSPINGEGIHSSIISGKAAAEAAIISLENGGQIEFLKNYRRHPEIKQIIDTFKIKRVLVDYFCKNEGRNLDKLFEIAESNREFKIQLLDIFLGRQSAAPLDKVMAILRA